MFRRLEFRGESGLLTAPAGNATVGWSGEEDVIWVESGVTARGPDDDNFDAASYIYGPFRATYTVNSYGQILSGTCNETNQWRDGIEWDPDHDNWKEAGT